MRSYCAGSGRVISGGSSTSRSRAVALLGEPGERAVAGPLPGARRGVLERPPAGAGSASVQPVEVQPLVGALEQRLPGEVRQVLPVGADAATDGVPALLLGRPVLPARDVDAGDQPAQVPLPGAGMGLVEVVEVEDEVALGGGVEAEVAQVRVTADHRRDAGGGQPGEVLRHHPGRAAEEGERAGGHPPDPHRDQPAHPARVARDHLLHRVGAPGVRGPSRPAPSVAPAAGAPPDLVALARGTWPACRSDANAAASVEASTVCPRAGPAMGPAWQTVPATQRSSGRPV